MQSMKLISLLSLIILLPTFTADAEETEFTHTALIGRWDLVVHGVDSEYPSWLEVRKSGYSTLVGSYVGQFGSARPIAEITPRYITSLRETHAPVSSTRFGNLFSVLVIVLSVPGPSPLIVPNPTIFD